MQTVLIVIHLMIVLALIVVVLLQRSEGGALGIGGGGGLMSSRGQANALTRATGILAAGFFATSLAMAILAGTHRVPDSLLNQAIGGQNPQVPTSGGILNTLRPGNGTAPAQGEQPQAPAAPSAPLSGQPSPAPAQQPATPPAAPAAPAPGAQ
jgi:preprotein translocase subunit SecG